MFLREFCQHGQSFMRKSQVVLEILKNFIQGYTLPIDEGLNKNLPYCCH